MAGLQEQVALVTGASRGVGHGVATGLSHAGEMVDAGVQAAYVAAQHAARRTVAARRGLHGRRTAASRAH